VACASQASCTTDTGMAHTSTAQTQTCAGCAAHQMLAEPCPRPAATIRKGHSKLGHHPQGTQQAGPPSARDAASWATAAHSGQKATTASLQGTRSRGSKHELQYTPRARSTAPMLPMIVGIAYRTHGPPETGGFGVQCRQKARTCASFRPSTCASRSPAADRLPDVRAAFRGACQPLP
jgi:hypothetical protein